MPGALVSPAEGDRYGKEIIQVYVVTDTGGSVMRDIQ